MNFFRYALSLFLLVFPMYVLSQTNSGANEQTQNPDEQTSKDNRKKAVFEGSSPFSLYKDSYGLFGYSNSSL